jgi:hypothetical protein
MVIQSCPSYFQFNCPSEEQTRANSYGTVLHYDKIGPKSKFTKDSTQCNALGIASVLSESNSATAIRHQHYQQHQRTSINMGYLLLSLSMLVSWLV